MEFDSVYLTASRLARERLQADYPKRVLRTGIFAVFEVVTLMPRFTIAQIRRLCPDFTESVLGDPFLLRALDHCKLTRNGEYAWRDEFWLMLQESEEGEAGRRLKLAASLKGLGDVTAAFEQWVFGHAFSLAEETLRSRFLTVFELLSPEGASFLLGLPKKVLRNRPMLRTLVSLLGTSGGFIALDTVEQGSEVLKRLGYRTAESDQLSGLMPRAVRAALLMQDERHLRKAATAATDVLQRIREWATPIPPEKSSTVAEAAVLSALVLFEIGAFPEDTVMLPLPSGSPYLVHRYSLLRDMIDLMHGDSARSDIPPPSSQAVRGYRALAFSEAKCILSIRAFQHFDERWSASEREGLNGELEATSSPQSDPLPEKTIPVEESSKTHRAAAPIPTGIAASTMPGILNALRSVWPLSTGDLPGAIAAAKQYQLFDPFDPFVMGLLLLAKNDPEQALSRLLPHAGRWGLRTSTIFTLLRAAALARLGKNAAARAALEEVGNLPYALVATGCTLLLREDLDALCELSTSDRFQTIARTAAEHGPLFTGNQFSTTGRFQPLTLKEWQVLELLKLGIAPKAMAVDLFVSFSTIRTHIRSLRRKLGANSVDEILSRVAEAGLTPPPPNNQGSAPAAI